MSPDVYVLTTTTTKTQIEIHIEECIKVIRMNFVSETNYAASVSTS